jgi:ADP-heptose:LPS heptosyltransferase
MPNLERTVVITKQPFGRHWLPLWQTTVTRWWDLVVDIRGSALSWLVPARRRAMMRPGSGPKILQLARVLRLDPAPSPVVWFSPADAKRASGLLRPGRPVVALAPTANWAPKIWPAERFVAFFQRISATYMPDAVPAIIAGPREDEAAVAAPVVDALPEAINLVGLLTVPEIAAFLARASLFVGNDSGLMHLAAAAGAPTLGMFGPTSISEYSPMGCRAASLAGTTSAMDSITVDAALDVARQLLAL